MNSTTDITVGQKGQVICRPSEWTDIVQFFFLNYGLHALTVITPPGATTLFTAELCLYAALLPFTGSLRALGAIHKCAKLEADQLAVAHKSGALCMVLQSKDIRGNLIKVLPEFINIHGQHPVKIPRRFELLRGVFAPRHDRDVVETAQPDPYHIVEVPEDFVVKPLIDPATICGPATGNHSRTKPNFQLSCNYNSIKSLAAILQILYSSFEIYEARGLQLQKFGYAAYSLTVIPYTIMSLLNLVASLCEPQYPTRFIVHYRGNIDTEAGAVDPNPGYRGAFGAQDRLPAGGGEGDMITRITTNTQQTEVLVSGAVGQASGAIETGLAEGSDSLTMKLQLERHWKAALAEYSTKNVSLGVVVYLLGVSALAAPYIIINLLTNFHVGQSTKSQRSWVMSWLVIGQYAGATFFPLLSLQFRNGLMDEARYDQTNIQITSSSCTMILASLIFSVSTIGGFVVIAKMIKHSDICKTI